MFFICVFIQCKFKVVIYCSPKAFMTKVLSLKILLKGIFIFTFLPFLHFLCLVHLIFRSASHSITTGMVHGQKPRYLTAKLSSIKIKVQPLIELWTWYSLPPARLPKPTNAYDPPFLLNKTYLHEQKRKQAELWTNI